jgi:hypothetical protein
MNTKKSFNQIVTLIFIGVSLAAGIAVVVLNILGTAELQSQTLLFGIGLACLAIVTLDTEKGVGK